MEKKYLEIIDARKAYSEGNNVTELLRIQNGININTPDIIEVAYDLQAGTYIDFVTEHHNDVSLFATEVGKILNNNITHGDTLLDIGAGELTTLSLVLSSMEMRPSEIFAFDISWSRIYKGISFAKNNMGVDYKNLKAFVGDISEIPLHDKSINVTTSCHALEPNGGKLKELLLELFRVTIDKLVLFEPCYEINSEKGKARMDKLGYIKDIEGVVKKLGGEIIETFKIENSINELNPTACFIIKPPVIADQTMNKDTGGYSLPGTNMSLKKVGDFYHSIETGLTFPILKGIPVIKSKCAVLATSLTK